MFCPLFPTKTIDGHLQGSPKFQKRLWAHKDEVEECIIQANLVAANKPANSCTGSQQKMLSTPKNGSGYKVNCRLEYSQV